MREDGKYRGGKGKDKVKYRGGREMLSRSELFLGEKKIFPRIFCQEMCKYIQRMQNVLRKTVRI